MSGVDLSAERNGVKYNLESKTICFRVPDIKDINFTTGAHMSFPEGNVRYSKSRYILRHMKYIGFNYFYNKALTLYKRGLADNKRGFCLTYSNSDEQLKNDYDNVLKLSKPIDDIHKNLYKNNLFVAWV